MKNGVRLNHYIAECGVCSRREADDLIARGRVEVNGETAVTGQRVDPAHDHILVEGRLLRARNEHIVVAWYKPAGVTTTDRDPHADRTIREAFHYPIRLTYAGRLDRDSEGLLLMTNDGALIDAMMRGANGHEKEYIVRTVKRLTDEDLIRMREGIYLRDLGVKTRPARVERLGDRTFRIVLTQGLNRQIRRMVAARGNEVKWLRRVRVLNVTLGALKPGGQREVRGDELAKLYAEAGLDS